MPRRKEVPTDSYRGFKIDRWNPPLPRPGAYLFTQLETGKCYVGISQNVLKRVEGHKAGNGSKSTMIFHRAIKKHGASAFLFQPLFYSLDGTIGLRSLEIDLIIEYDSLWPVGYNLIAAGTVGPYGSVFGGIIKAAKNRPESVAKTSASIKALLEDPEYRASWVAATQAGLTPEVIARRNISIAKALNDPEYKKTQSARVSGSKWITNGIIAKRVPKAAPVPDGWWAGRLDSPNTPRGESHGDRMRIALANPETRARLSKTAKGKMRITNGTREQLIESGGVIPDGWWRGRVETFYSEDYSDKQAANMAGRIYITDGQKDRRIWPDETVPSGWKRGRSPQPNAIRNNQYTKKTTKPKDS